MQVVRITNGLPSPTLSQGRSPSHTNAHVVLLEDLNPSGTFSLLFALSFAPSYFVLVLKSTPSGSTLVVSTPSLSFLLRSWNFLQKYLHEAITLLFPCLPSHFGSSHVHSSLLRLDLLCVDKVCFGARSWCIVLLLIVQGFNELVLLL